MKAWCATSIPVSNHPLSRIPAWLWGSPEAESARCGFFFSFFLGIGTEKYNIHVCKPLETSLEEEEEVWRCLACSLWRGWGEFWGLGVPFALMLLGEAVFIWCFPFLGSAVEGEGFPWLAWLSAGLCRQDMGREGEEDHAPAAGPGHFWMSRSSGCGRGAGVQASPERLGLGVCVIWGKVRRDFLGREECKFPPSHMSPVLPVCNKSHQIAQDLAAGTA